MRLDYRDIQLESSSIDGGWKGLGILTGKRVWYVALKPAALVLEFLNGVGSKPTRVKHRGIALLVLILKLNIDGEHIGAEMNLDFYYYTW